MSHDRSFTCAAHAQPIDSGSGPDSAKSDVFQKRAEWPFGDYVVSLARDDDERRATYALRYQEYCLNLRSLDPGDYPDGLERDAFDTTAVHFVGRYRGGSIVGTTRLVLQVDGKFLMETGPEAFTLPDWFPRSTTMESSRLIAQKVIDDAGRPIRQSQYLLQASCRWSLDHAVTHWLVASQYDFYQHLNARGWPFVVIGDPKAYHNTHSIPVILELAELWQRIFADP